MTRTPVLKHTRHPTGSWPQLLMIVTVLYLCFGFGFGIEFARSTPETNQLIDVTDRTPSLLTRSADIDDRLSTKSPNWRPSQMRLVDNIVADRAASWDWPAENARVIRRFEKPEHEYATGHRGIDIFAPPGTAIFSVADGTVVVARSVAGRPVMTIEHPNGIRSTYTGVTSLVDEGTTVDQGTRIGEAAATVGHHAAFHLGAMIGAEYLDPLSLLPARERAVLLPRL